MNSPILEYLASYGVDPAYIMIGLLAVMLIVLALHIVVLVRFRKLRRTYRRFMMGKDMESMEETILKQLDRIDALEKSNRQKERQIGDIFNNLKSVYQKSGLVRYDAFREMSGDLSYALALLDEENNGILVNSMYSREGCYSYAKEIVRGESQINLAEEEKEALKIAMDK